MFDPVLLGTIATFYGVGGALAALCQAHQIRQRGSSCDVSAGFFAMYAGGYAIWLMYGVSIGSLPLILVDAAGLICGGITLAVTLSMRGSLTRPRSWTRCA
jgi:MtN3 and saliva related transmembrane protein